MLLVFGIYIAQTRCCKTENQDFVVTGIGNSAIRCSFFAIKQCGEGVCEYPADTIFCRILKIVLC